MLWAREWSNTMMDKVMSLPKLMLLCWTLLKPWKPTVNHLLSTMKKISIEAEQRWWKEMDLLGAYWTKVMRWKRQALMMFQILWKNSLSWLNRWWCNPMRCRTEKSLNLLIWVLVLLGRMSSDNLSLWVKVLLPHNWIWARLRTEDNPFQEVESPILRELEYR